MLKFTNFILDKAYWDRRSAKFGEENKIRNTEDLRLVDIYVREEAKS